MGRKEKKKEFSRQIFNVFLPVRSRLSRKREASNRKYRCTRGIIETVPAIRLKAGEFVPRDGQLIVMLLNRVRVRVREFDTSRKYLLLVVTPRILAILVYTGGDACPCAGTRSEISTRPMHEVHAHRDAPSPSLIGMRAHVPDDSIFGSRGVTGRGHGTL